MSEVSQPVSRDDSRPVDPMKAQLSGGNDPVVTGDRRSPSPARGYTWDPFRAGNTAAEVHGANSERRVAPLAAEIERDARALPSWPEYLDEPTYAPAVAAWCRAEAIVELLWRWLAEQDPLDALASTSESTTDVEEFRGGSRSRTTGRQVESVLAQLAKWEAAAARQRQRLGLDPMSRARLGRDHAAARVDVVEVLTRLAEQRDQDAADPLSSTATVPPSTDRPTTVGDHR